VGSIGVVVDPPFFNGLPYVSEADEEMLVKALVAQPAVEALDEAMESCRQIAAIAIATARTP
jgi:hypothetical protein